MPRLGRQYDRLQKAKKTDDSVVNPLAAAKSFSAAPQDIVVVPGFNIRKRNEEHVESFRQAYEAGRYVPPILVAVVEDGSLELVDGHHRLEGAIRAGVKRVPLAEFEGTYEDRFAEAVRSSQGLALTPTERARAYRTMRANGWLNEEIAERVARSVSDVRNHLLLADCGDTVLAMVESGVAAARPVMDLARKVSPERVEGMLNTALERKQAAEAADATPPASEAPVETPAADTPAPATKAKKPRAKKAGAKVARPVLSPTDMGLKFAPEDALQELVSYIEPVGEETLEDLRKMLDEGDVIDAWQSMTLRMPLAKLVPMLEQMKMYTPVLPYDKRNADGSPDTEELGS